MNGERRVKVWDPFVRVFHWTLVGSFFLAWLTEDDLLGLHVWAGYTVLGLIVLRILWGFIGTRHARFSDFVFSPGTVRRYLKDVLWFRARRYLGHNPAGGAMILALLFSLLLTGLTGVALLGAAENAGPLAGWLGAHPGLEEPLEEVHEFFANLTLGLVVLHVAGVVWESLVHRENLVRAMIDGYKRADDTRG